jgi:hypothetical protein
MKTSACLILCWVATATAQVKAEPELRVIEAQAFVYEQPELKSSVLRRLYLGELVSPIEELTPTDGSHWISIRLGGEATGYVRKEKLGPPTLLPTDTWRAPYFVRDERPFVFGARVAGETLGMAINLRYQPFTRLGMSLSLGAVIDPPTQKGAVGPSIGLGVYSAFLLSNLSPIIELGLSHATYSSGATSLELLNAYITAGAEYMADNGLFIHIYFTYVRGLSMGLSMPLSAANGSPLERPHFGWLDSWAQVGASFNFFFPGVTAGYAF